MITTRVKHKAPAVPLSVPISDDVDAEWKWPVGRACDDVRARLFRWL